MKKLLPLMLIALFSLQTKAQTVELVQFGPTFTDPVDIAHAGDDRLFIVEQAGRIKILNTDGTVSTFLDIRSIVSDNANEKGLLGLAFAPDYATSGRFYVNYTDNNGPNAGNTIIARYTVSSDPDVANTNGTTILTINQRYSNHNGGEIVFGPDGYLYIGMGDGGSGGDPGNRAQNPDVLLGKLLRIDVSGATYTNPPGNPYLSGGGEPEIYAIGLRNPWKMTFDRETDDLWIADVGQSSYEEMNVVDPTEAGLNYGWRCYEGMHPFNTSGGCPPMANTVIPVSEYEYGNSPGGFRCSITGGYVYRGAMYPNFTGKYFFADFCSQEIGILTNSGGTWTQDLQAPNESGGWTTFGEDINGELYIAGSSRVYKITDPNVLNTSSFSEYNFKLFPNPTRDLVNIDFGNRFSEVDVISIYNIQGQKIEQLNTKNEKMISISTKALTRGLYLVELSSAKGLKSVEKLVIK